MILPKVTVTREGCYGSLVPEPCAMAICRYFKCFMYLKIVQCMCAALVPVLLSGVVQARGSNGLQDFEQLAARFKSVIRLPEFETTTNQVREAVRLTISQGNAGLDKVAAVPESQVTFESTVRALDDIGYRITLTAQRL